MRIPGSGRRREQIAPKKRKRVEFSADTSFSEVFQAEVIEQIDLERALEEVEEYAERLRRNPLLENLVRYKKKVQDILRFLIQQSYNVKESIFYDPLGRRRLLMLVETIDEKLEELTRDFLRAQDDNLELVGRLDEIRGLLLDLYS